MELSKIKNNNSILKNISFIFLMLIAILTLFNVKEVKAQDYVADSILEWTSRDNISSGVHTVTVTGIDGETITYPVHLIVLEGNQTITEDTVYGDEDDVGAAISYAQNMVIVKVKGNYTVNEGVTVSPIYTEYGGPKGFTLYVEGTLTNNGTIDNSHGAYAEGENVYLWKNIDGSFEYVPSTGATGTTTCDKSGNNGSGRQTGSGGSGKANIADCGRGATGTSYSGGPGGGAGGYRGEAVGVTGDSKGGAGGYGKAGGAGNPGGKGQNSSTNAAATGENGTGGLLVIYSDTYVNNGDITANGHLGGNDREGGGASGGGSINIFGYQFENNGQMNVSGGINTGNGGNGGNGTVTTTQLYKAPRLSNIKINGHLLENFDPEVFVYNYTLEQFSQFAFLEAESVYDTTVISGLGHYEILENSSKIVCLILTTPTGETQTYQININNLDVYYPNSYLRYININDGNIPIDYYQPKKTNYNIIIPEQYTWVKIEAEPFDDNANIEIKGNDFMISDNGIIKITVSLSGVSETVYTLNYSRVKTNESFDFTNNEQIFIPKITESDFH